MSSLRYSLAALALLILGFAAVAHYLATQPASAMSNGAPRLICTQCHVGADKNPAEFVVKGLPDKVEPGKEYTITIKITKGPESQGNAYGGFAVAVNQGELIVVDKENTFKTSLPDGTVIITQTKKGSMKREWKFAWKAPDQCNGPVVFKISVIAANGDGSFNGDAYAHKEIKVECAGGAKPAVTTTTVVETTTTTSPVTTVVERNAMLATGVAVVIFLVVVAGYLLLARK